MAVSFRRIELVRFPRILVVLSSGGIVDDLREREKLGAYFEVRALGGVCVDDKSHAVVL